MRSALQNAKAISPLVLLLCSITKAQITLPTLTGCIGNPTGTATYSTEMTVETGTERIVAGDFWSQLGAVWVFSSDTEGVQFGQPGIPGYGAGFGGGGPPAAAQSALKLDPSKTAWTLSVPTSTLGGQWDIVWAATATGKVHQIISGESPCLGAVASSTVSGNAAIASSCVNNQISTATAIWSTYGVCITSGVQGDEMLTSYRSRPTCRVFSTQQHRLLLTLRSTVLRSFMMTLTPQEQCAHILLVCST